MAWVERMVSPKAEGPFESWSSLSAGLMPLLTEEVGRLFLPWSAANAEAIAQGREDLHHDARRRDLDAGAAKVPRPLAAGDPPQVRRCEGRRRLDEILEKAGCLSVLRSGAAA